MKIECTVEELKELVKKETPSDKTLDADKTIKEALSQEIHRVGEYPLELNLQTPDLPKYLKKPQ